MGDFVRIINRFDNSYDQVAVQYPDENIVILNDASVLLDDICNNSIAWKNECPELIEQIANAKDLFRFHYTLSKKLESGDHKFKKLYTWDKRYATYPNVKIIKPSAATWVDASESKIYDKTKNVTFITSKKNWLTYHRKRLYLADAMIKNNMDVHGHGYNSIEKKVEVLKDHRFCFVIENGVYAGWHTEKILDCFRTGTVPIYLGDPDIGDTFDTSGIISLNDDFNADDLLASIEDRLTDELYESMLPAITKNFKISMEYKNDPITIMDEILNDFHK
jgi:hypothetical protein